jgi:hypothetical protein
VAKTTANREKKSRTVAKNTTGEPPGIKLPINQKIEAKQHDKWCYQIMAWNKQ